MTAVNMLYYGDNPMKAWTPDEDDALVAMGGLPIDD